MVQVLPKSEDAFLGYSLTQILFKAAHKYDIIWAGLNKFKSIYI